MHKNSTKDRLQCCRYYWKKIAFLLLISGNVDLHLLAKISEGTEKILQKGTAQVPHGIVQTSMCGCWGFRYLRANAWLGRTWQEHWQTAKWDQSRTPRDDSTDLVKYKALQTIPFKTFLVLSLGFFFFCVMRSYIAIGYQKHTQCCFTLPKWKLKRTALAENRKQSATQENGVGSSGWGKKPT